MTMHRHLRPWVWVALGVITGIMTGILFIICAAATIEAITGFNPLWLIGSM